MADRFGSFAELAAATQEGVDYRIRVTERDSRAVILAPHGGTIEPETSEIAEAIAGDVHSFYAFEALEEGDDGDFHVTSHRFDEPRAVELVGRADAAVALHGRRDDGTDSVWLGGLALEFRDAIGDALRAAGFEAEFNARLAGTNATNIVNRTRSGAGVQLELSRSFRHKLAEDEAPFARFAAVIREAVTAWIAR